MEINNILDASILIVDDQQANVQLLEQMLGEAGYTHLTSTTDPREVEALHRKNQYDLIVLDLLMPGMDGFQVMEALKDTAANDYLPILVITAEPGHKLRALAAGAKDFVAKPFDLVELKLRIHNMLEMRLLYKQLELSIRKFESLALHDELTGLPNRRLLMDRLTITIAHARRNRFPVAVMFLDMDDFKLINDTLGHTVGDKLLHRVAARLTAAVRDEDTVARIGGDEFVIALWEYSNDGDLAYLATKVLQAVSQPYQIDGQSVNITASIGIATYPLHGEEAETLIKNADTALYEAKRAGKNSYRVSSTLLSQPSVARRTEQPS